MSDRIRGLDGLRAVAVGLVLVMHKTDFGTSTRIGFYGVWLFFLLSGYLITGQLRAARRRVDDGGSGVFRELMIFWHRRAFRIFPAYYAVLAAVSLYYFFTNHELHGLIFYVIHLSNVYLSANMEQFHTTWAHFWSLAVEEQFYLLFAPLFLFTPAHHAIKVCFALAIASLIQRVVQTAGGVDPFQIYIDSTINFGLLASGGVLCLVIEPVKKFLRASRLDGGIAGWIGFALYLALAISTTHLLGNSPAMLQFAYVVAGGVSIFVLANVVAGQQNSLVGCLELPAVALVGRLSYAIYLINDYVPADIPMRILSKMPGLAGAGQRISSGMTTSLTVFGVLLSFAVTVGAAYVCWILIEKPALVMRDQLGGKLAFFNVRVKGFAAAKARRPIVNATLES